MSQAAGINTPGKGQEWRPPEALQPPALFSWPPRPGPLLKWLFGYPGFLWPWNTLYVAIAVATWAFLTPQLSTMKNFHLGWVALIFAQNLILLLIVVGAWHLRLYTSQSQGMEYKYSGRWLAKKNSSFWFKNQLADNIFWTLCSGVPIWTAFQVFTFWGQANGYFPVVSWSAHPVYCVLLMLFIPFFRETHFYLIHRLLHARALYPWVHSLHHANVFPGPWSGLAMHPVEHLLYFSSAILFWIVPSSTLHVVFSMQHAAFTPSQGHSGFHKVKLGEGIEHDNDCLMHYLHHRYFEVNYGGDGLVPLDKWVGTYHDGTPEAHEAMNRRILARTTAAQRVD